MDQKHQPQAVANRMQVVSRRKHIIDKAKIKNLFSPKKRQIEGLPIIKKGRLMDSLLQNRAEK